MRVLLSEWLRTKRTAIRWFIFGLPVFLAGCTVVYLTLSPGSTQDFAFEGFFTIWSGIMIPVSVGILGGAVIREEELAGNFNGFLSFGVSRAENISGQVYVSGDMYVRLYIVGSADPGMWDESVCSLRGGYEGVSPCCCIHFDRSGSSSGPSSLDQPCVGMGRFHRA